MTLIITCVAEREIVQASDSFLTMPDGSLFQDDAIKATFYCGHVVFAYTGLAVINDEDTGMWLSARLAEAPDGTIFDVLDFITERATADVAKTKASNKTLAIMGAGWYEEPAKRTHYVDESGPAAEVWMMPFLCSVANFDNWEPHSWTSKPDDVFRPWVTPRPDGSNMAWRADGIPLDDTERPPLHHTLSAIANRGLGAKEIAPVLVKQIRDISIRDRRVGGGILVTSLPAQAAGRAAAFDVRGIGHAFFAPDRATALYYPQVGADPEAHRYSNFACKGFASAGTSVLRVPAGSSFDPWKDVEGLGNR